jgi:hypothetical protein
MAAAAAIGKRPCLPEQHGILLHEVSLRLAAQRGPKQLLHRQLLAVARGPQAHQGGRGGQRNQLGFVQDACRGPAWHLQSGGPARGQHDQEQ